MAASRRHDRMGPSVKYVQIDGLVVLKMVKHCDDEVSDPSDVAQGVLLGLVEGERLEVTNCFPFPRQPEGDNTFDEVDYQMEMMRNLRHVNVDHLHVGWYQSTNLMSFLNKTLVDSQFNYQSSIEESVVLIYDPFRTSHGKLTLKAYRLTPQMMQMYKEQEFTAEAVKRVGLKCEDVFEEIPVVLKNSHLINMLMCELEEEGVGTGNYKHLDLGTGDLIEKGQGLLMGSVDALAQESSRYAMHMRNVQRTITSKQQAIAKRAVENEARKERGEPPLADDDIHRQYKLPPAPSRLEATLTSAQVHMYCKQINELSSQAFGKLFLADALHSDPSKGTSASSS